MGDITPLNVTLEQAIDILKKRPKGSSELRKLGNHPETGEELILKDGRYGPYVADGKVNASLKKEFGWISQSMDSYSSQIAEESLHQRRFGLR